MAPALEGRRWRQGRERGRQEGSRPRVPKPKSSATLSSTGCAPCAFSIRPAAPAISFIWPCRASRTSNGAPSSIARRSASAWRAARRPGNPARHRDQPVCRRTRAHHDLDRRHPMAGEERHPPPPAAGPAQARPIECRDALLTPDGKGGFVEAEWPEADFIVGNPPFLGGKLHADAGLGDAKVETLFKVYAAGFPPRRPRLLLVRQGVGGGGRQSARSVSAWSRPIRFAAARTAKCWSRSRRQARSSRRGATSRGLSMARRSASRWYALRCELKETRSLDGARSRVAFTPDL